MKSFLPITILAFLFLTPLSAQTIKEAFNGYYERAALVTLTEHFKGLKERQSTRTILTSDPESREGMFFILNIEDITAVSSIRIHYIPSDKIAPTTTQFSLIGKNPKAWIYLGLTGNDWTGEDLQVLAWKVDLLNSDKEVITEWKSFLWEKKS